MRSVLLSICLAGTIPAPLAWGDLPSLDEETVSVGSAEDAEIAPPTEAERLADGLLGMLAAEKQAQRKSVNLTRARAVFHATAALRASKLTGIEAELLLAMTLFESSYNTYSISRMVETDGIWERKTGHVYGRAKPKNVRGPYFCGVMQVGSGGTSLSWDDCWRFIDDIPGTYLEGAQHLVDWMDDKTCRNRKGTKRLQCGLLAYRGGYPGIAANGNYPSRAFRIRNAIKHYTPKTTS